MISSEQQNTYLSLGLLRSCNLQLTVYTLSAKKYIFHFKETDYCFCEHNLFSTDYK